MKKQQLKKRNLALAGLLAAGVLVLSGCGAEPAVPALLEPVGVQLDTETVARGDLVRTEVFEGYLAPGETAVSFPVDGVIGSIAVYPGQQVKAGDVLMQLDQQQIEEQLESTRRQIEYLVSVGAYDDQIADIDIACLEMEYRDAVGGYGADSENAALLYLDLEAAKLAKKQAIESRENALARLWETLGALTDRTAPQQLTAPHDGRVYYYDNITAGAYVQSGETVCFVSDETKLTLTTQSYVAESALGSKTCYALIGGQRYEVQYLPMPEEQKQEIILSGAQLYSQFAVTGPAKATEALAAGQYAVVCLETARRDGVLLVPVNALGTDAEGQHVYVITGGKREKRRVETGLSDGARIEITAGLAEGEVVYVQE